MATFQSLNISTNTETKTFSINEQTVNVLQYLPIDQKYDLVTITLQNAEEDGIYNPIVLDAYFHLYIVKMYTDIEFSEEEMFNALDAYDALVSQGVLAEILKLIPDEEYDMLHCALTDFMELKMKYLTTAAAMIQKIVNDLPKNAEAANKVVESFDKDKYANLIELARSLGGGKPVV